MTTQFAKASYQEIIDLQTVADNVTVVGIHTPTSKQPYEYLSGFFRQFKKYRYLGCSMALVPAARLPADPAQVGYDAGELPIDARDILNPVLFHGCHGNALGPILNQFIAGPDASTSFASARTTPSIDEWKKSFSKGSAWADMYEALYYRALTDNTWLKAHPQSGFRKKGMHPLIYDVSTNHPIGNIPMGHTSIYPRDVSLYNGDIETYSGTMGLGSNSTTDSNGNKSAFLREQFPQGQFDVIDPSGSVKGKLTQNVDASGYNYFTSKLHPLGWLDTTLRIPFSTDGYTAQFNGLAPTQSELNNFLDDMTEQPNLLPLLYMGIILLPPAYKATQCMRLVLNHRFAFKGFRGISTNSSWKGQALMVGGSNFMDSYFPIPAGNSKDLESKESDGDTDERD